MQPSTTSKNRRKTPCTTVTGNVGRGWVLCPRNFRSRMRIGDDMVRTQDHGWNDVPMLVGIGSSRRKKEAPILTAKQTYDLRAWTPISGRCGQPQRGSGWGRGTTQWPWASWCSSTGVKRRGIATSGVRGCGALRSRNLEWMQLIESSTEWALTPRKWASIPVRNKVKKWQKKKNLTLRPLL